MSFPYRPGPPPGHQPVAETGSAETGRPVESPETGHPAGSSETGHPAGSSETGHPAGSSETGHPAGSSETGHPAVDDVLRSRENAAQLPPAEQIAEFEAAHQVLRETLASIDG
jgi:hypothetical protein